MGDEAAKPLQGAASKEISKEKDGGGGAKEEKDKSCVLIDKSELDYTGPLRYLPMMLIRNRFIHQKN